MSHKQKTPAEEKIRVVRACLSGELSQREAAQQAKVPARTMRHWIDQYKAEGEGAFLPRANNRFYTAALKTKAVLSYLHGEGSLRDICMKYHIRSTRQLGYSDRKSVV